MHFCSTREFVCIAVGSQKTFPSSLKSVKASASSTLTNPLTCRAKEQALYHSWMLVDFHIWHYVDLLLGDLCPILHQNAPYGAYNHFTCAQLCNNKHHPHPLLCPQFFFTSGCWHYCPNKIKNWKLEFAGDVERNLYKVFRASSVVSIISLICTLSCIHSLLFSLADPSLQCYSTGE